MLAPTQDTSGESTSNKFGHRWTWRLLLFAFVAGAIHAGLAWTFRTPGIATRSDDAEYLLLSSELARGAYRDAYDVDSPTHAKYPPGYPAVLAATKAVVSDTEDSFLALNALFSAVAILLLLDWSRRKVNVVTWYAMTPVLVLNPEVVLHSGMVLSESLFGFLIVLSLWLEPDGRSKWRTVAATVITASTALVRTAGLAVCFGMVGARFSERRWLAGSALILVTAASGGWWLKHSLNAPNAADRSLYVADLTSPATVTAGSVWKSTLQRVPEKIRLMVTDQVPTAVGIPTIRGSWVDNAVGAALLIVLVPIGLFQLWRVWRPAAGVLLAYGALNLIWPWTIVRFVVPVVGLLVVTLFLGVDYLRKRWPSPQVGVMATLVLAFYLSIGAVTRLSRDVGRYVGCNKHVPYDNPACFPIEGDWQFLQAASYARDSLPPDAVFFTAKEPSFYYQAGLKTVNSLSLLREDSTSLANGLRRRGVEWVITSFVGPYREQISKLVGSACRDFDLVKQFDERTSILRLRPSTLPNDQGPACEALASWRMVSAESTERVTQPRISWRTGAATP